MLISSISALVIGTFNHQFNMKDGFKACFDGFNHTMLHQSHISDNAKTLIEQGGMMSMTQIIVTIFCGYAFAGIVEKAGCLDVILETIAKGVKSIGTLVLITVVCSIMLVFAAGVASIVIIMVGVLMKDMFEKMNVSKAVLSRTLKIQVQWYCHSFHGAHLVYIMHNNLMFQLISFYMGNPMLLMCLHCNNLWLYRYRN